MSDRFDFEQALLRCWGTVEDINLIAERHMDSPDGPLSEDDLSNLLLGVANIHNARCARLFEMFERMVHEGKIR